MQPRSSFISCEEVKTFNLPKLVSFYLRFIMESILYYHTNTIYEVSGIIEAYN